MTKRVTIILDTADAEPVLRDYAEQAARYSAMLDHITKRTMRVPGRSYMSGPDNLPELRRDWSEAFLRAKRIVESFGVEMEAISEQEAMTVYIPERILKSRRVNLGGLAFNRVDKSVPDYDNPISEWRGDVATEACQHAAGRVVCAWRATLSN